ncbi:hypothetical protein HW130_30610 [Streptomyces sp. PKU-EA00015]|uniref:hypothetical protein n=1 Tax=Streptomyces sp. PKU-EA00015 TaxID=2748326 RepID=UPI00159F8736|nr:hypothetical protein [Streptomyces sp. PKU-EA00015]NWF30557.1 hypothetical protein [Streptomyces sp. PKU-EA00015]
MTTALDDRCPRDGCDFFPQLVMIDGSALPAVHCSDACADFVWLERAIDEAPPSRDKAAALEALGGLRRLLNSRQHPSDVGPLLGDV